MIEIEYQIGRDLKDHLILLSLQKYSLVKMAQHIPT